MAAGDLTSRVNVRAFLQKPASDTAQDALIDALITRASKAIQKVTRIFQPTETGVGKSFEYEGRGLLSLNPWYARAVTAVTITDHGASTPRTLTAADYEVKFLRPGTTEAQQPEDGVYTHLWLPNEIDRRGHLEMLNLDRSIAQKRTVTVTGNWGYGTTPDDVEHWCIVTVVIWLRREVAAFSTTFALDEERLERPEALPSAVRAGLRPYGRDDH